MKDVAKNYGGILLCVFELLVGILLLINPEGFTSAIIIAAGGVLLVAGVISVIKYFKTEAELAAQGSLFSTGLCEIALGLFLGIGHQLIIGTFGILTKLYGVVILASGFIKVQTTVDMLRAGNQKWFVAAASALITIICALVIVFVPFAATIVLWKFTGIVLIVEAVADVAVLIVNRKRDSKKGEVVPNEN